jgi:hypothetical protein
MDAHEQRGYDVPDDFGGLMFYPYVFNRGDLSADAEIRRQELVGLVQAVKDHPDLLVYEQRNEPSYTFGDASSPQSPPEGMIAGSQVIRELDPHHPIRVGHMNCNLVSTLRKYNPAIDIVGCNPYVVMAPGMRRFVGTRSDGRIVDSPNQTLSAVGDLTDKMMRVADGRAVWMQLQGMANENWFNPAHTPELRGTTAYEHDRLYPNRWQMRFMAYCAIVRGATGMSWSLYGMEIDIGPWREVCEVIGELSRLHDVLASPVWDGRLEVEYNELGFSDWTGVETLVKLHEGKPSIIAVNTQFDPMEATFSHLPEGISEQLNVFGEDRQVAVRSGRFTDYFRPYEVHVYRSTIDQETPIAPDARS